ncbi:hypothetical protein I2I05_18990 [Hymenobacter sp. BT683]|uniref:Uncharacterized protein n=1 Tax=Hymenobacter jeongseonensis TaxID=2791027 RepID=A0ABS0IMP8_9BACT|nr:hypothetical protein [Hymenobacter jeongseonensis]MBF9239487.1 hypothetical protein [Hymenobacter jeongseonensis]
MEPKVRSLADISKFKIHATSGDRVRVGEKSTVSAEIIQASALVRIAEAMEAQAELLRSLCQQHGALVPEGGC